MRITLIVVVAKHGDSFLELLHCHWSEWLSPQQTDQALWQGWGGVGVGIELEGGPHEQNHTGS